MSRQFLFFTHTHVFLSTFFNQQELCCLVLEWVPKGSLGNMLEDEAAGLRWDEPLLRLATDVARGMAYLHGRSYFDESDDTYKSCILHRDLKVRSRLR
jgi:serine/threonine protein kinase